MTPEKKQRIVQIRAYNSLSYTVSDNNQVAAGLLRDARKDIDFLLSFVESQEVVAPIDATAAAQGIVEAHIHETRAIGHTDCDACLDADANAVAAIVSAVTDAAASMRSRCVEKVKALRDTYNDEAAVTIDKDRGLLLDCGIVALNRAINELESVSIQEQEK